MKRNFKHKQALYDDEDDLESYSKYVSEYLAELMTAIGNFRNAELQKTITLEWIEKVSKLQTYFDGLSVRFALEIGIGKQLKYFEKDLIERLQSI